MAITKALSCGEKFANTFRLTDFTRLLVFFGRLREVKERAAVDEVFDGHFPGRSFIGMYPGEIPRHDPRYKWIMLKQTDGDAFSRDRLHVAAEFLNKDDAQNAVTIAQRKAQPRQYFAARPNRKW